MKFQFVLPVY